MRIPAVRRPGDEEALVVLELLALLDDEHLPPAGRWAAEELRTWIGLRMPSLQSRLGMRLPAE